MGKVGKLMAEEGQRCQNNNILTYKESSRPLISSKKISWQSWQICIVKCQNPKIYSYRSHINDFQLNRALHLLQLFWFFQSAKDDWHRMNFQLMGRHERKFSATFRITLWLSISVWLMETKKLVSAQGTSNKSNW